MTKQLEKRHRRKVARAKAQVKLSEPDLRTPEQIQEARQASRATWNTGGARRANPAAPAFLNSRAAPAGSAAKTDA